MAMTPRPRWHSPHCLRQSALTRPRTLPSPLSEAQPWRCRIPRRTRPPCPPRRLHRRCLCRSLQCPIRLSSDRPKGPLLRHHPSRRQPRVHRIRWHWRPMFLLALAITRPRRRVVRPQRPRRHPPKWLPSRHQRDRDPSRLLCPPPLLRRPWRILTGRQRQPLAASRRPSRRQSIAKSPWPRDLQTASPPPRSRAL